MTDVCAITKGMEMEDGFYKVLILVPLLAAMLIMPVRVSAAELTPVSQELDVALGTVGRATTLEDNLHVGPNSELNMDVKYVASPQINKDLLLRVGAEWQRFSFASRQHAAVPDTLQQANAIVGLDYQLAEQWLARRGAAGPVRRFSPTQLAKL